MRTSTWTSTTTGQSPLLPQATWYVAGATVGFLVPFIFSSTLDLHHDLYYAVYFSVAIAFLATYAMVSHVDLVALFTQRWKWSLGLGAVAAFIVVMGVLRREDSTARPDGWYLWFQVLWRGGLYGAIDALLLSGFPVAVAYAMHNQRLGTWPRRVSFAVLSAVLVIVITATYHLGYQQFRDDGIGGPEIGNSIISVPAIATLNPIGSVLAHSSMHVAAVLHSYETELYLPPVTEAE